jgi:hypothetical protein
LGSYYNKRIKKEIMPNKIDIEKETNQNLDKIMVMLEILAQLDDIDLLGNSIPMKIKVINKIDNLLDRL